MMTRASIAWTLAAAALAMVGAWWALSWATGTAEQVADE